MTDPQAVRQARGFDWRLAPLQRKLEWEADAARTRVARALAQWEAAGASLRGAEALLRQAGQDARGAVSAHADPRAHRRLLAYLVSLGDQVAVVTARELEAGEQLAAARQELLRRQRRLDVVLRARDNALDAYLGQQARAQQSQADASWLALRERRRGREGLEGQT